MDWMAEVADAATVFNPRATPFQPGGRGQPLGHTLQVPASRYVPLAPMWVPHGTVDSGAGRRSTFASRAAWPMPRPCPHEQLARAGGLNATWCWTMPPQPLQPRRHPGLRLAAQLTDPASGRAMGVAPPPACRCTQATASGDPARDLGRGPGRAYRLLAAGDGIAWSHGYPDAPNHLAFPVVVAAGRCGAAASCTGSRAPEGCLGSLLSNK